MDKTITAEYSPQEAERLRTEIEVSLREISRAIDRIDADQEQITAIRLRTDARMAEIDEILKDIRAANSRIAAA